MTLFVKRTGRAEARLGITATRRIGGAVTRNRAKRLARELFRHQPISPGLDIVVVPRREFSDAPYLGLYREFSALLERALRLPGSESRAGRPRRSRADSRI
jgi:ribonuclease P protein component